MPKKQAILSACILIFLGMIFYSYLSGEDLSWWLKGWAIVCAAAFVARLYEKYRNNKDDDA